MNQLHKKKFQRINIVGASGSGKSTLSRKLSEILSVPHIEMDAIFWQPNWKEPDDDTFFTKLSAEISRFPNWVLDGNYTRTIPIKWNNVQLVVWLDYSFIRTIFQSLKRSIIRAFGEKELWTGTGNKESWHRLFSKDSIVLYTARTHGKVRKKYELIIRNRSYSHIQFVRCRSPKEAEKIIDHIKILS